MNETILIRGAINRRGMYRMILLITAICILAGLIIFCISAIDYATCREKVYGELCKDRDPIKRYKCFKHDIADSPAGFGFKQNKYLIIALGGLAVVLDLICLIAIMFIRKYSITITDKYVSYTAPFGKRIELPVDTISSIGTTWFKGIKVSSPSGKIFLLMVNHRNEVYHCLRNLVAARQRNIAIPSQSAASATFDESEKA